MRKWWINYLNDVWTSKKIVHVESRRWRAKGRKRERETGEEIRGSAGARLDDRPRSTHFYGCVDLYPRGRCGDLPTSTFSATFYL